VSERFGSWREVPRAETEQRRKLVRVGHGERFHALDLFWDFAGAPARTLCGRTGVRIGSSGTADCAQCLKRIKDRANA
jgi:hypothetical protein